MVASDSSYDPLRRAVRMIAQPLCRPRLLMHRTGRSTWQVLCDILREARKCGRSESPQRRLEGLMSIFDEFMEANARYAANFTMGDLPRAPARKVAVITCMDSRMNPLKILGLEDGDANVIRNAGGRAADAIRTLVISQQLLGTREIAVIHHTECGMMAFD